MDTIGNMLNSIINAQKVNKKRVAVPYSRFKEALARLLHEKGLLAAMRVQESTPANKLILSLAYDGAGSPRVHGVRRVSRPGQRVYVSSRHIPYVLDGVGSVIVSTSQGLMDDRQARRNHLGGELICEIW